MNETSRYVVGIDVGTSMVRCVVGHIDETNGIPTVVGVGTAPNRGMRKGIVNDLNGPAQAIDHALGEAERMSGYEVNDALLSINGTHILSTKSYGMIAVGNIEHEITLEDIDRVEEVATVGKIPANRQVLSIVPYSFRLDGQDNIRDPLGMTGTRLELDANVVSALKPHIINLHKAAEMATVMAHGTEVAVLAAARAVLNDGQLENGVAVIDFGAATTSLAVFEAGDLQYVSVLAVGGANITNDLAIGLKVDPEVAEVAKQKHARATGHDKPTPINIKQENTSVSFSSDELDEIVEARLEEIFVALEKELKKAGWNGKLPNGVVLTGGGANLPGLVDYAKDKLGLSARVGKPSGFGGVADDIEDPGYATAIGLMLIDDSMVGKIDNHRGKKRSGSSGFGKVGSKGLSIIKSLFKNLKS